MASFWAKKATCGSGGMAHMGQKKRSKPLGLVVLLFFGAPRPHLGVWRARCWWCPWAPPCCSSRLLSATRRALGSDLPSSPRLKRAAWSKGLWLATHFVGRSLVYPTHSQHSTSFCRTPSGCALINFQRETKGGTFAILRILLHRWVEWL